MSAGNLPVQLARRKKKARASYHSGQHGGKGQEQKRLSSEFDTKVTGDTHESEHPVGYEPLARFVDKSKGVPKRTLLRSKPTKPKKTKKPRSEKQQKKVDETYRKNMMRWKEEGGRGPTLEKKAPAYQEVKALHRAHVGTGTGGVDKESGFTDESYRSAQRELLKSKQISSAVQLNQLVYSSMDDFRAPPDEKPMKIADNSYANMVDRMSSFRHAEGSKDVETPINESQRHEMRLARIAARTGKWPVKEATEYNRKYAEEEKRGKKRARD